MRAWASLTSSRHFQVVARDGRRARSGHVSATAAPAPLGGGGTRPRVGLAVRAAGAVDRNRIKRRLRGALDRLELPAGVDLVIGAGPSLLACSSQEMEEGLASAVARATT